MQDKELFIYQNVIFKNGTYTFKPRLIYNIAKCPPLSMQLFAKDRKEGNKGTQKGTKHY